MMDKTKKAFLVILLIIMALILVSCGEKPNGTCDSCGKEKVVKLYKITSPYDEVRYMNYCDDCYKSMKLSVQLLDGTIEQVDNVDPVELVQQVIRPDLRKVIDFGWKRTIEIEKIANVQKTDWVLPEGANLISKQEAVHHYDSELDHYEEMELQRSRQVIDHYDGDTPVYVTENYTETVKQPVYKQVECYQTQYTFEIPDVISTRLVESSGTDHNPLWPSYTLEEGEREGARHGEYYISVADSNGAKNILTIDEDVWNRLKIGDSYN